MKLVKQYLTVSDLVFFLSYSTYQRRSLGGGGAVGYICPRRQGAGAPKWNLQKCHKGKKPISSKIGPELR